MGSHEASIEWISASAGMPPGFQQRVDLRLLVKGKARIEKDAFYFKEHWRLIDIYGPPEDPEDCLTVDKCFDGNAEVTHWRSVAHRPIGRWSRLIDWVFPKFKSRR